MLNSMYGFLHRHPKLETKAELDNNHVIVDKKEWEAIRVGFQKYSKALELCKWMATAYEGNDGNILESDSRMAFIKALGIANEK